MSEVPGFIVSEMTSPTVLKLTSERTLNTTSCLSQRAMNDLKSSIAIRVGGIQCGGDVSCQATVNIADAGCSSGHRMRRSLGTTVTITLESPLPDGDLQLAEFITSKKGIENSPALAVEYRVPDAI